MQLDKQNTVMNVILLLVGLALILAGANFLTAGASSLAVRFRISEFIVGFTIVAIGTSMPELVVSVMSAIEGHPDMAVGNVVGSNIFNTFLILGVAALVMPLPFTDSNVRRDIPFGVLASAVMFFMCADRWIDGTADMISRSDGLVLLSLFILYMVYSVYSAPSAGEPDSKIERMPVWKIVVWIAGGLTALIFGADMFLDSSVAIARSLNVSEAVISITLVAAGTSLPELATSVVAAAKGRGELALGNVVGSNIANIFLIVGLSATIQPLGMGGITQWDVLLMLAASVMLLLTAFTFKKWRLDRWEGVCFIAIYIAYMFYLLYR